MQVEILCIWISNASRNLRQMETLSPSDKNKKNKNKNKNNKVILKTAITAISRSKILIFLDFENGFYLPIYHCALSSQQAFST